MLTIAIRLTPQISVRSSVPRRFRQPAAASILMLTRQACARQAEAQVLKMKATAVRPFPSYLLPMLLVPMPQASQVWSCV